MHIIICDDDDEIMSHMSAMVSSYFKKRKIELTLECAATTATAIAAARRKAPDVAILDLTLGDGDGYGLAGEFRALSLDTEIIFVTAHARRMHGAFPYRPVAFLVKPVAEQSLNEALDTVFFYRWHEGLYYVVRALGEDHRVPHKSIRYFESNGHQVILHIKDRESPLAFRKKLDEVEAELVGLPYVRCHKSYIVQFDAIRTIDRTALCFVLYGGGCVPISRRYYDHVFDAFTRYKTR